MTRMWTASLGLAVAFLCCASLRADDVSSLKAELADLKAKVASMESARDEGGSCGGECESLVSMSKKGRVQIGGNVEIDINVVRRDDFPGRYDANAGTWSWNRDDKVDSTTFRTGDADLDFKIKATSDSYLKIKLDLDDFWDEDVDQDDLLEECYFLWDNVWCTDMGVVIGKKEAPYGQDKDVVITDSYHHNDGSGTWLGRAHEALDVTSVNPLGLDNSNPHAPIALDRVAHPGEKDNVFQVGMFYTWCDFAKLEAAVFQNNDTTGNGRSTRGMHEDRSDDHLGFQSGAVRLTLLPTEGLKIMLSAINQHTDKYQDSMSMATGGHTIVYRGKDDQNAFSAAFDYKFCAMPLELFGEYQYGNDWAYSDDYKIHVAQLGAIWGVCENIDLIAEGEWMGIKDNRIVGRNNHQDYWKAVVAGKYTLDSGIYMMIEYCHEWYDGDADHSDDADADAISFRTAWKF